MRLRWLPFLLLASGDPTRAFGQIAFGQIAFGQIAFGQIAFGQIALGLAGAAGREDARAIAERGEGF